MEQSLVAACEPGDPRIGSEEMVGRGTPLSARQRFALDLRIDATVYEKLKRAQFGWSQNMREAFCSSAHSNELSAPDRPRSFRADGIATASRHSAADSPGEPVIEPSDRSLILRSRNGDQDAATKLYARYSSRLANLVAKQCSAALARCAGVEDIVQSVFGSFFRHVGHGYYDIPGGDELWKLLLVIALNKVRGKASYYHAAKRDMHRTIHGAAAEQHIESLPNSRQPTSEHLELVVNEILERLPSQNRSMVQLRLDGCEVAEVARLTGRSKRSVERILQDTRIQLRELLREED
jgi:RNA polymerase sigma-70 factor, ECF subfamily